ncbi:Ran-specific GTPase-activating protein 30 [Colletotrichum trifolii]|uniref:Ran-specific GTPase-activating protein 30 n=1 Tax=Colletotrichum trifolii TaxID=5466 RepID=A0A4R8QX45_COLTR|nr:Ran-specific GTPase-activating protein 30 [Colletotrichum trifolii]
MKTVDDRDVRSELKRLQTVLDSKIKVVSPAIDLIEFKSGRGNAFLESALPLAKGLHQEMAALGRRVEQAAQAGEAPKGLLEVNRHGEHQLEELKAIISDMKSLLARIDRDIPLLHMAITASGESLNSSMSPSISPSRLLQAGMFLTFGDTQYAADPFRPVQIGPAFTLSLYMLFVGHAAQYPGTEHKRPSHLPDTPCTPQREEPRQYGFKEGDRKPLWQEAIHKARVRLCRTPMDYAFDSENGFHSATSTNRHSKTDRMFGSGHHPLGQHNGYAYHLEVVEDLDDGRVHDEVDAQTSAYDDIDSAGIRESIPIHQISKIFYADTGRILNVGNDGGFDSNPVLLLKRDMSSKPPSHLEEEIVACTNDEVSDAGSVTGRALEEEEDQEDIDRQLREESAALDMLKELPGPKVGGPRLRFPCHLDPEWIALEVFEEDDVETYAQPSNDTDQGIDITIARQRPQDKS